MFSQAFYPLTITLFVCLNVLWVMTSVSNPTVLCKVWFFQGMYFPCHKTWQLSGMAEKLVFLSLR